MVGSRHGNGVAYAGLASWAGDVLTRKDKARKGILSVVVYAVSSHAGGRACRDKRRAFLPPRDELHVRTPR